MTSKPWREQFREQFEAGLDARRDRAEEAGEPEDESPIDVSIRFSPIPGSSAREVIPALGRVDDGGFVVPSRTAGFMLTPGVVLLCGYAEESMGLDSQDDGGGFARVDDSHSWRAVDIELRVAGRPWNAAVSPDGDTSPLAVGGKAPFDRADIAGVLDLIESKARSVVTPSGPSPRR